MIDKILAELKRTFIILLVGNLVCCTVIIIVRGGFDWQGIKNFTFYNLYYGFPLSILNGLFFNNLDAILPWERGPKARLWLGIIGSIVLTMIVLFALNFILWVLIWGAEPKALFSERNRIFYLIGLIITVIISAIGLAKEFFDKVQEQILITERLEKEKLESELSVLKAHIDPHFLFNSFNLLSGLIEEDPKKAQQALTGLSGIYRHILENRDKNTTTIQEELAFAKKYLSLQQARFENAIILNIDVSDKNYEKQIPTLTLQLLLENAIKHNAFDEHHPLIIDIYEEEKFIVIKNNKKARKNLLEGNGLGLQNIKDRYQLLSNLEIIIDDHESYFAVKIPML